ncbi:MAG: bifunctional 2-polyprenyl-6-hydroxyphenol methylase/3-demethylubiquinol 3-O-methyltransferase UbiG [Sphingomonadaceae bacterium]|jgi:2-polyprenyl-6-hydroxyphenyl methylase/3-demethylubiquinone-9 3-methyltransferase|nr:bifunctional 2-polyprenyl-6-hydroxyphenol methylase/3-demethylubiquinol 3-O-methyltransferase UbiG [Sphingomonadaceae bacterium]NBU78097.1 bifunctional 2-polyprenyl-6-hydroxyphenol methylase/3-demethylubiquinol 3-O-methyltransferase UbiG [Sphingomonadaceae bacterium]NCA00994.1 bifunctional 2-polyprenyl-6-hydroxyphenol methylase/3-demethylubiquinol 3-O-methyltransferase UbiG [Sphingomonadaceae bacterium]
MAKASTPTTINPAEAAHFGKLAADWWDPTGSSAMLHKLNPVRLRFIRAAIDAHWPGQEGSFRPLSGRMALDVGCGAGLLCEPLARLGADVTGVDAAPENVAAAQHHADAGGLAIAYRCADVAAMDGVFDLVTSMEVIEHVTDPAAFISALADRLAPGGLMILSTPNRTAKSKLAMITLAEGLGAIPKGTHDWDKFLTPEELTPLLEAAGLRLGTISGIAFSPSAGLHLSDDLSLNYILTATRA